MANEIGIGIAYDGEKIGIALVVSDDEMGEEITLTLYPDRAAYLGTRLLEISEALPELEELVRGLPMEHAEAHIYNWVEKSGSSPG